MEDVHHEVGFEILIRFIAPDTFMGWQQGQFVTAVLLGFAGVALLLASFGLFSVACYAIAHRTREFGIRIALGATPGSVLRAARNRRPSPWPSASSSA